LCAQRRNVRGDPPLTHGARVGDALRCAEAKVEAGLSGVEIEIPSSTAARVIAETTLGSVDVGDGFTKREGSFLTEVALRASVNRRVSYVSSDDTKAFLSY
jgi:hypothetical protein